MKRDVDLTESEVPLVNGSKVTATTLLYWDGNANNNVYVDTGADSGTAYNLRLDEAPTKNGPVTVDVQKYINQYDQLGSQADAVATDLDDYINATYDKWQTGKINSSELVDPYLGARSYSPSGDYQTWSMLSYTSLGYSVPEGASNFGQMTVSTEGGTNYTGVLLTDGIPQNGTFEVGQQYDASALQGEQFIATDGGSKIDLQGNFTVLQLTTSDGGTMETVSYSNPDYKTTNLSELQSLYEELATLRAEIEARSPGTNGSAGGGSGFSQQQIAALALAGGAVLLVLGREGGARY
jgi:hypothetical protein